MTAGRRRLVGAAVTLAALVGLVWVVLLPMRQAPFTVESHELRVEPGGAAIAGRLLNRGPAVPWLLVEAYLYDPERRYLGTAQAAVEGVPGGATVDFRIPVDPRLAPHVARYSLYAGTSPNPFAPEPR